jgi:hypothetical protein
MWKSLLQLLHGTTKISSRGVCLLVVRFWVLGLVLVLQSGFLSVERGLHDFSPLCCCTTYSGSSGWTNVVIFFYVLCVLNLSMGFQSC